MQWKLLILQCQTATIAFYAFKCVSIIVEDLVKANNFGT